MRRLWTSDEFLGHQASSAASRKPQAKAHYNSSAHEILQEKLALDYKLHNIHLSALTVRHNPRNINMDTIPVTKKLIAFGTKQIFLYDTLPIDSYDKKASQD